MLGRTEAPDTDVTFDDFLSAVERQDPLRMDLHWRPQHLNLMHPVFTYDLLGRLEHFDRDIHEVCRRLDLPSPRWFAHQLPQRPSQRLRRPGPTGSGCAALDADDIEVYGYMRRGGRPARGRAERVSERWPRARPDGGASARAAAPGSPGQLQQALETSRLEVLVGRGVVGRGAGGIARRPSHRGGPSPWHGRISSHLDMNPSSVPAGSVRTGPAHGFG